METLIINIFQDVLMRQPTPAELSNALSQLNGGTSTDTFIANLVDSQECVEIVQPVAGIYGALFGRTPDKAGLKFWVDQHRSVQFLDVADTTTPTGEPTFDETFGREALISTLKLMVNPNQTAEFASLYGTGQTSGRTYLATDLVTDTITANDVGLTGQAILRGPSAAEFIDGLYFNILGRAPDPAGRAFWIQQYNNRVEQQTAKGSINPENDARAFIIDRFVDAEEFENNIGSYLVQFLNGAGQDPDPENLYADPANLAAAGSLGNDAPELLDVIARVEENSPAGTVVATLEVFDRDFNDSGTFSISDPTGNFEIDGDKIVVGPSAALDFETQNSYVVQISATDVGPVGGSGLSDTEEVTITILDVDENVAPTLVTSAGTVLENSDAGTRVTTLVSTDPDIGDTPFYLIESDASGLFDINDDELVVRAGADIDFEQSPSHDVSIRVTDSRGAFSTSTLTVQIADVNEAPSLLTAPGSIQENAAAGEVASSFAVSDPDADDTFSVTLADPSGLFELTAANNIVVKSGANIDFETVSSHTVTLTATDASNLSAVKDVVINVTDVVEAQNITLTSSADTPSPSSQGVNTLGGAGPELYSGILRINDSNSTINSNDIIDGADGEDTLDIRILGTPSNNRILELTTMNVEKIQFRIQPGNENGFATVDMTTAENVEELWLKDSPGDENSNGNVFLQVNNLNPSNLEFIGLENVQGNFFVNLTGQSGRSNSDNDAFNLSLNGAKNQNDAIFFLLNTDSGTDTTFEIVNIFSTGSESEVEFFDPLDLTHVNVTGDAQLTLSEFKDNPGEGFETLKSVDASGMTGGGLDINAVLASASDFSFIGSGFDDVLLVSREMLNTTANSIVINGGEGKDILVTESFNFAAFPTALSTINSATSIEVLAAFEAVTSLEIGDFSTIKEFVFAGESINNGTLNIREIENDSHLVFSEDHQRGGSPVIRFHGDSAGTALSMELRANSDSGGHVEIIKTAGSSGNDEAAIDFRDISSVSIASTGENAEANVITAVRNTSFDRFAFDNDGITNFSITGNQDLTIGALAGDSQGENRDVRGFSEVVNVNASSFSGNLRISGSNGADAISGGSGDDIIYGLNDDNTLTGNGGSDQFRIANLNEDDNSITDFLVGSDKIGFNTSGTIDFNNTAATTEGAILSSADYVENRFQVGQLGNSDDQKVVELQSELSQSQIEADTGAAIEAFVLVFNSTTSKGELWHDSDWSDSGGRDLVFIFENVSSLVGVTQFSASDFVEFVA